MINLEIDEMPSRIASLPVDPVRKIPVPWFVAWIDGKPEFRVADGEKRSLAVREKRCWVCGEKLGRIMTFVIGPMCGINRTSMEPPSHSDCALYSVRHCPFLSRPQMDRRESGMDALVEQGASCDGEMIRRNPGVSALWNTRDYKMFNDGKGGYLLRVGDPESVWWFCEGRQATCEEVEASIVSGIPLLLNMARKQIEEDAQVRLQHVLELIKGQYRDLKPWLPKPLEAAK